MPPCKGLRVSPARTTWARVTATGSRSNELRCVNTGPPVVADVETKRLSRRKVNAPCSLWLAERARRFGDAGDGFGSCYDLRGGPDGTNFAIGSPAVGVETENDNRRAWGFKIPLHELQRTARRCNPQRRAEALLYAPGTPARPFLRLSACVFPANPMGRAGFEPATLGLKVGVRLLWWLGHAGRNAPLSQISSHVLGCAGAALLTFC